MIASRQGFSFMFHPKMAPYQLHADEGLTLGRRECHLPSSQPRIGAFLESLPTQRQPKPTSWTWPTVQTEMPPIDRAELSNSTWNISTLPAPPTATLQQNPSSMVSACLHALPPWYMEARPQQLTPPLLQALHQISLCSRQDKCAHTCIAAGKPLAQPAPGLR